MSPLLPSACLLPISDGHSALALTLQTQTKCCTIRRNTNLVMKGAFVQNRTRNPQFSLQPEKSNPNITSAIGMQETAGSLRAKRHSLFTQTVIWVTGVICMAFLLGSLAQAWSNSQLAQKVEVAQQQLSQLKDEQKHLNQLV